MSSENNGSERSGIKKAYEYAVKTTNTRCAYLATAKCMNECKLNCDFRNRVEAYLTGYEESDTKNI